MKTKLKIILLAAALFMPMLLTDATYALEETWGPQDRNTSFTWNDPASYVTFNSIKENPFIGNETNFVRVKEYVEGEEGNHVDNVTVEPGKEYEVWIYYHNNASSSLNADGSGLAQNTRVSSSFPTKLTAGESGVIRGGITATNATPSGVWDTAFFNANETVWLSYVPNSAVLHTSDNCKGVDGTVLSSKALFVNSEQVGTDVTAGAMISCYDSDDLWGVIPGCNEYAGYITYRVKVDQPGFWTEKTVAAKGSSDYAETISGAPGDVFNFKIYYKNTGTSDQTVVTVHDELPDGLEYVSGSMNVESASDAGDEITGETETKLFEENGLVIGNFKAGEEATITYQAKLADVESFDCGENVIYNNASIETENGAEFDKVKITVVKACDADAATGVTELPKTGPTEMAIAVGILVAIAVGGTYYVTSYNKIRRTTSAITGGNASAAKKETTEDIVKDGIVSDDK